MGSLYIVIFVILAVVVSTLLFFIIKSTVSPKRLDAVPKLISQGKIQQAIKLSKQILAKDPKDYTAHYYLGKAYIADNKNELALMEMKFVSENALFGERINEGEFRKQFSELLVRYNQNNEALREYLLLTKLEPRNADNYFQAGRIYESINRYDLAMGYMKKTTDLDKKHAKAHAELGLMHFRTKQYNEAKKEIDLALKLSPDTYSSYFYLGKIMKEAKDLPAAIKAFEKAQRDPEFKQKAIIERGTCYMMANRSDNAIPDFQRAIDLDKEGVHNETLYARYFLANCYEQNRKIDKAIEQWEYIYKRNKAFRDVGSKLSEYKELQSNDYLKDYLTCSDDEFQLICKNAVNKVLRLKVLSMELKKWGCQITGVEMKDEWMSVRKQVILLRFYREPNPIDDSAVRETLDLMKQQNFAKGFLLSPTGFTNAGKHFAENRPVELVEKDKLEKILTKAGQ